MYLYRLYKIGTETGLAHLLLEVRLGGTITVLVSVLYRMCIKLHDGFKGTWEEKHNGR